MLYLLCILFPPLAVLLAGRPGAAILNLFLTLCFYFPGAIHAFAVVADAKADRRAIRMVVQIAASGKRRRSSPLRRDYDPLTDPEAMWRIDPASSAQKAKLKFFGVSFNSGISKGQASDLLDALDDPAMEVKYQHWKSTRGKSGPITKVFLGVTAVAFCMVAYSMLQHRGDSSSITPSVRPAVASPAPLDAQKRAMRMFPDLGVPGSPLNRAFLARYSQMKATNDPALRNPDWPMKLAQSLSGESSKP